MRWNLFLISFLFLGGCSGGGSELPEAEEPGVVVRSRDLVKVTYIRFNFDRKKNRYQPVYQVLLSESWKRKFGNNPKEPYSKLFPRKGNHTPYMGIVPDREMRSFQKKLVRQGLSALVAVSPEDVDLVALAQVRLSREEPPYTRIITVGNGKEAQSWLFRKNNYSMESIRQFVKCEKMILEMVALYAAQISMESLPIRPGDR